MSRTRRGFLGVLAALPFAGALFRGDPALRARPDVPGSERVLLRWKGWAYELALIPQNSGPVIYRPRMLPPPKGAFWERYAPIKRRAERVEFRFRGESMQDPDRYALIPVYEEA